MKSFPCAESLQQILEELDLHPEQGASIGFLFNGKVVILEYQRNMSDPIGSWYQLGPV